MADTGVERRRYLTKAELTLRNIVFVVLAAGSASRMGFAKVTAPLAGRSPIERLADVLGDRAVVIVTTAVHEAACSLALPWASVLINQAPIGGMTSSLLVANDAIEFSATLGVMLADKPFVRKETFARCEHALEAAQPCDILFPTVDGEAGHPVYFGPKARARLTALPPGETLRAVRDDPALAQIALACGDPGILIDLDGPDAWRAAEKRLRSRA